MSFEQMGTLDTQFSNVRTESSRTPMTFTEWILKSRYAIVIAILMAILAWAVAARGATSF
jgi:hypothetical protein